MEIIQIIMLIISFLSAIFNFDIPGLDNLFPKPQVAYSENYRCGRASWSQAPEMNGNTFRGEVEVYCNVRGVSGGGIQELRSHMADVLPRGADQIYSEWVENFEGLPSVGYDLSLVSDLNGEPVVVRGETRIATNGFTELRNEFRTTDIQNLAMSKYVRDMRSEVSVNTTRVNGWYTIRFAQQKEVSKPSLVSRSRFYQQMVEDTQENLEAKAPELASDLCQHL